MCATTTGIIVGVVTFTIGITLGVLLAFLVSCVYSRLHSKPSTHPVHVSKQPNSQHQPLPEYQDVQFKSSRCIPVIQNTAYGHGGRALDQRSRHKEIELEENVAYGTN